MPAGAGVELHVVTFLVHGSSSNCVGSLFALRAHFIQGADVETAIEVGRLHGLTSLEEAVREKLD